MENTFLDTFLDGTMKWRSFDDSAMDYPLAICYSLLLNMAIFIVNFPMKNGGSFHSYVS